FLSYRFIMSDFFVILFLFCFFFFFFSSRRRHTRSKRDWSSDVCSSDLDLANHLLSGGLDFWWRRRAANIVRSWKPGRVLDLATRSEERRVGKECRYRGARED